MNKKLEKILVVEDNAKHLKDARATYSQLNLDYATNLEEAFQYLSQEKYGGIISDVFFPTSKNGSRNEDQIGDIFDTLLDITLELGDNLTYEIVDGMSSWNEKEDIPPSGILIAEYAKQKKMPLVFCTDGYHHGARLEPVNQYCKKNDIELADVYLSDKDGMAETKDWKGAFEKLQTIYGDENER